MHRSSQIFGCNLVGAFFVIWITLFLREFAILHESIAADGFSSFMLPLQGFLNAIIYSESYKRVASIFPRALFERSSTAVQNLKSRFFDNRQSSTSILDGSNTATWHRGMLVSDESRNDKNLSRNHDSEDPNETIGHGIEGDSNSPSVMEDIMESPPGQDGAPGVSSEATTSDVEIENFQNLTNRFFSSRQMSTSTRDISNTANGHGGILVSAESRNEMDPSPNHDSEDPDVDIGRGIEGDSNSQSVMEDIMESPPGQDGAPGISSETIVSDVEMDDFPPENGRVF